MMNMKTLKLVAALSLCAANAHSAIHLEWSATSGETKNIYSLTGPDVIVDWGDGSSDSGSSHTYSAAGDYVVTISGKVTALDLRGDDATAGASGITKFLLDESNNSLTSLNIWGNSLLTSIDVTKAVALTSINTTATAITSLDLSKNLALSSIDLKLCSNLTDLLVADCYPSLLTVDVNNSALSACSLNSLFQALPSASGTIYTTGCSGDATSSPLIVTSKGWTFGNGGSGDGSAVCVDPLAEVSGVSSSKIAGTNDYTVSWNEASGADSYSVRLYLKSDSSLCAASYFLTSGTSVSISDVDTPSDYAFYVYSVSGKSFVKSGPYSFGELSSAAVLNSTVNTAWTQVEGNSVKVCNLTSGETVNVYSAAGQLVASKAVADTVASFVLPNGNYVITFGNQSLKVNVFNK